MLQAGSLLRPRKLFYGWVVVAVCFVGQTFHNGIGFQGLGAFLVPLEQEFGWSKTTLASARSLSTVESGLLGPLQGAITDKIGPRITMMSGMMVLGAGMVMLGFIHSLWTYYIAFAVIALGGSLGGFITMSVVLNNWFGGSGPWPYPWGRWESGWAASSWSPA